MFNFFETFEKISEQQHKRVVRGDEYKDEASGLIMCGKCKEPLQCRVRGMTFPVVCRCEREADEKIKKQLDEYQYLQRQKQLNAGVKADAFKVYTFDRDDKRNIPITKLCCDYIRHWREMEQISGGLLFYGDVGGGKTFYAGCIANALIKRSVPVLFTSLRDLVDNRQAAKYKGAELWNLKEYRLFVLDDIGAEKLNRADLDSAFQVIDDIYLLQKPLIVTTNLDLEQLRTPNNQEIARLYSRILERCPKPVFVGNQRNRLTAADEKQKQLDAILNLF